ncbi:lysozyme inhibitor LprI family protein [Rhizobium sp. CAU 1783]
MSVTSRPGPTVTALLTAVPILAFSSAASAASFDCNRQGLAADEVAICENRDLNDLDVKMVTTFELISGLLPMGNRGELQDQQSAWLRQRQDCGADVDCLERAYEDRITQINRVYDTIEKTQ